VSRANHRRVRHRRVQAGGALLATLALATVAIVLATDATARLGASGSSPASAVVAHPIPPLAGAPPRLSLVTAGDSVGLTLAEGLTRVGDPQGYSVRGGAFLGCGLEPAGQTFFRPARLDVTPNGCPDWQHYWPALAAITKADVAVFLGGTWDMFDRYVDNHRVNFASPESDRTLSALLDTMIDGYASSGTAVALLTSPYYSAAESSATEPLNQSAFDPPRVDHWNVLLRAAAARHPTEARIVDLNAFVSPGGFTDTVAGVTPVRGDGEHFTDAGADLVATWLLPRLADVARLATPRAA
jgi:SGNH domain (fused to AT3 domains)